MTRSLRILLSTVTTANSTATTSSPPAKHSSPAAEPPQSVAVESDFVVILAALLCALICVVGLIAVARCAWLRRGTPGNGRVPGQRSPNKGLKKKIVQSLPKYTYDSSSSATGAGDGIGAVTGDCAICLAEYADGDEIRVLPQCGHGFHVQCIDTWLGSHSSCPSCRQILVVARCQKCGEFPAMNVSGAAQVATPAETQVKQTRSDRRAAAAAVPSSSYFLP
ncbi:unnamed protein product [Coffea canephora]|uniref:RING-type domain-containing protein n=2 Tax=Coffea TaxID=13442 RepID=A0A068U0T1_COFCA|nr:RING-H2 finger protein ATL80-like [Coffea arabica]CDP01769.1 unnamed protein product [Coffea canephora]